jgi:hypothetical protein
MLHRMKSGVQYRRQGSSSERGRFPATDPYPPNYYQLLFRLETGLPVNEGIIKAEDVDKVLELPLEMESAVFGDALVRAKDR